MKNFTPPKGWGILNNFLLGEDQESFHTSIDRLTADVPFKGTNLWVLIFAIFVASIGLNVNSTAVIIGAMLISPLMGPIMGIGLGLGINDIQLVKNAVKNFTFAVGVSVAASAIYFSVSPLGDAHSELLARTTPAIWDVLIAFFGGLAGIVASLSKSKRKGNVIPGVAIATALMPPLCTVGYGLAHFKGEFFFGALYLFLINSVFISLATLVTVRLLKFPFKAYTDPIREARVKQLIWMIVIATVTPSIYIAYRIVKKNQFMNAATNYINYETAIADNYLLNKTIDPDKRSITLVYGGKGLTEFQKNNLKLHLADYKLANIKLEIHEGFTLKSLEKTAPEQTKYMATIAEQEKKIGELESKIDSVKNYSSFLVQLTREAKAEHPEMEYLSISPLISDTIRDSIYVATFRFSKKPDKKERDELEDWLKVKFKGKKIALVID